MKKILYILILLLGSTSVGHAQMYSGMAGLIQVPSAEMDSVGDARIGAHFLNKAMLPNSGSFMIGGSKYNSFDAYLALTPFWWVEMSFVMTFEKGDGAGGHPHRIAQKDRHFNVKFNPLREGRWWPALAVGMQDCFSYCNDEHQGLFTNYYVAATKHVMIGAQEIGGTLVYRHYESAADHGWNGVIGGITYRPSFARNFRAVVEWTGCQVNVGVDCVLWKHLVAQVSLTDGKRISGGMAYKVNLF